METEAKIAQLGERMTEDHKVRCSIHLLGAFFFGQGGSRIIVIGVFSNEKDE